jgi:nitrogen regulatory protein PII
MAMETQTETQTETQIEAQPEMKALYIIVNTGFTDRVMDLLRESGARGGTIIHARGEGSHHHSFLGITLDFEREIIVTLVNADTAAKILAAVQENIGWKTELRGICYTMPIEKIVGISRPES